MQKNSYKNEPIKIKYDTLGVIKMTDKLSYFNDFSLRLREFIISTYNNMPNTLFVTSLLLGGIQGNLSMMWVCMGMILNAIIIFGLQESLGILFPSWDQVYQPGTRICSLIHDTMSPPLVIVSPSYWFASTTYFVVFILYNAFQVASKPANKGVDPNKVDVRVAFSMSVIILSIFFFLLLMLRGLTGCETWLGSITGILTGSLVGIMYWHLLDLCHSGIPPDILNVVSSLAPSKGLEEETPVICKVATATS